MVSKEVDTKTSITSFGMINKPQEVGTKMFYQKGNPNFKEVME